MMTELEKCLNGELYNTSDPEIQKLIHSARNLIRRFNGTDSKDSEQRQQIHRELFGGMGKNVNIDGPFCCDYGKHIFLGNNVIININCTFIDCNKITIGNNVLIASHVQIYTATHPVHQAERLVSDWQENSEVPYFRTYALAVTIEGNANINAIGS